MMLANFQKAYVTSKDQLFNLSGTVVTREGQQQSLMFTLLLVLVALVGWFVIQVRNRSVPTRKYPPGVPGGLPMIGNLMQLRSRKPYRTLTALSEIYGPIYQLDLGALKYVVVTSPELAKEVAVTKYEKISKRHLSNSLKVWTGNKLLVAMADYGDEYRKIKKMLSSQVLAAAPQKSLRAFREQQLKTAIEEVVANLNGSSAPVNIRETVKHYLFPFVMHQIMGYVPQCVHVPALGNLGLWDLFDHLVINPMKSVTTVDWRDFFPIFKWVPNPSFDKTVVDVAKMRSQVVQALITQKRHLLELQGPSGGFLEHMLTVQTDLNSFTVEQLMWEPIIQGSDTSLVTTEWAMYELAKNPDIQDRIYEEIEKVVGSRMVTESDLPNLPLVDAVLNETLRVYSPIVLLPPREVEEDITIGGYDIPKGWQLLINVYGINNDKKRWEKWNQWMPDRFLNAPELRDMGVNDFQLIPFGLGKRRCAGVLQATTIVSSFIACFVQNFRWSLAPSDGASLEDMAYLSTQKLRPLEVIARPRFCNNQPDVTA